MKAVALLLLFACSLPAQVVTLHNGSANPWTGWRRVAVSQQPPHVCGWDRATDVRYFAGDGFVDVRCTLASGQARTIDLATVRLVRMPRPQLPDDLFTHFGGGLDVGTITAVEESAAGFRIASLDLETVWYPSQPGWCHAALVPGSAVQQAVYVPVFGDAAVWLDPRPLTFVWHRHLRPQDFDDAAADCLVVGQ